jgi:hypothetical protein
LAFRPMIQGMQVLERTSLRGTFENLADEQHKGLLSGVDLPSRRRAA